MKYSKLKVLYPRVANESVKKMNMTVGLAYDDKVNVMVHITYKQIAYEKPVSLNLFPYVVLNYCIYGVTE